MYIGLLKILKGVVEIFLLVNHLIIVVEGELGFPLLALVPLVLVRMEKSLLHSSSNNNSVNNNNNKDVPQELLDQDQGSSKDNREKCGEREALPILHFLPPLNTSSLNNGHVSNNNLVSCFLKFQGSHHPELQLLLWILEGREGHLLHQ